MASSFQRQEFDVVDLSKTSPHWIAGHRAFLGYFYTTRNAALATGSRLVWGYCWAAMCNLVLVFISRLSLGHVASQTVEKT